MQLRFIRKQHENGNVWSFFFEPASPFSWKPGQFLYCSLKHNHMDNRGDHRYFTIASAPHEQTIRFTVRYFETASSAFKQKMFSLEPGAGMDVYPPDGSFTIEDYSKKYLCIAGGIGITPFRSQCNNFNHEKAFPDLVLVYGSQTPDPIFSQEFDAYTKTYPRFNVLYRIAPQVINAEFITGHVADYKERLLYVSGPEPMVKTIAPMLQTLGVPKRFIKTDYFPGYTI